jgi:hypothetical protein
MKGEELLLPEKETEEPRGEDPPRPRTTLVDVLCRAARGRRAFRRPHVEAGVTVEVAPGSVEGYCGAGQGAAGAGFFVHKD